MSHISQNLGLTVLHLGEPADLMTVSDNFDAIDAVVGDIATVESSPTASSHAVGEFLLYEGRLYKVTAAISAGGSLILGTNVQAANIGSEIKSLRDSLGSKTGSYVFEENNMYVEFSSGARVYIAFRENQIVGIKRRADGTWASEKTLASW